MDLPFNTVVFKVGGVTAGHVTHAVRSCRPPRCLRELSAAVFVRPSPSFLYLANTVT